jgi:hypothetical protein
VGGKGFSHHLQADNASAASYYGLINSQATAIYLKGNGNKQIIVWMNVGINENSILHHVLSRPYQYVLYFQNVIWFQGTHIKLISFTHEEKHGLPWHQF